MQTHSLQMKMIILYLHEVEQKLLILRHSLRAFVKHGNTVLATLMFYQIKNLGAHKLKAQNSISGHLRSH